MAYDALTIDTNIPIQGGLKLEAGLLGQLAQFKDERPEVVLSEIAIREIHRHLTQQVKKARDAIVSAASRVEDVQLLDTGAAAALKAQLAALDQPRTVAGARLRRFLEATGATTIPVSLAPMDDVVRAYFAASPPFEATGPKKDEFPDAIALMSIEAWAKAGGKKVLAISDDKGWIEFGQASEHVDVEPDFAKALEIVQEHAEAAEAAMASLLAKIEGGELPDVAAGVEAGISRALADWQFVAEGGGSFSLEVDATELDLISYEFDKFGGDYDITVVRIGSSDVVARIGLTITANARADFSLAAWDSVDKEYMDMGSRSAELEVEFNASILLMLAGDISGDLGELQVEKVELVEAVGSVDFGEIELDYDDDEDYQAWLAEEHEAEMAAERASELDEPEAVPF